MEYLPGLYYGILARTILVITIYLPGLNYGILARTILARTIPMIAR